MAFTLYSCTNCKQELEAIKSDCDSLQGIIDSLRGNCLFESDLVLSDCDNPRLMEETDQVVLRNQIDNYKNFLGGIYSDVNNARGFYISNKNLLEIIHDVLTTGSNGIFIQFASDSTKPKLFRQYISYVSCSKDSTGNIYKVITGSPYKYSDVGCPMHCVKE